MNETLNLKNRRLSVNVRLPDAQRPNLRFDSSVAIEEVELDRRHHFCTVERFDTSKQTSHGFGLNGEWKLKGAAEFARKGEYFPKPGVGLLCQIEDGKPYGIFEKYQVKPFRKEWEYGQDWITFTEIPEECMGIALLITRKLRLIENTIRLETVVRNVGKAEIELSEYQHNFINIDHMPIQQGYRYRLPYDRTLAELPNCFFDWDTLEHVNTSAVQVKDGEVIWTEPMNGRVYEKITESVHIMDVPEYRWKLSHEASPASISGIDLFKPSRLVLWTSDHCVCTEGYYTLWLSPGEEDSFVRKWEFQD